MALVGNLKDIKLPTLVQLNCMEKNTAKLTIDHAGKFGIIYFQDGQIVHAEFDPDIGEKAFFRLLKLAEGKFKVESGVRPPATTIEGHWNNLLLEALHQADALQMDGGIYVQLAEMLMNVKGVNRVAFIAQDGKPVSQAFKPDESFTLAALSYLEARLIASTLNKNGHTYVSILMGTSRLIISAYDENLVYIVLDSKTQIDTVLPFIIQVLNKEK
jgi:predicted regulator of Ras-like GTPase activity (Roadblock/LC7/MglB family)